MALSLSDLLTLALATLYAAYAITKTHGPYGIFTALRVRAPLGGLTACIVCCAFWCALVFWLLLQTDARPVVWVFAAAGGAVVVAHYVGMAQQ